MTPAPLPQHSSYPVNLFSDFGVRCNTLSDLTTWKKRAQAGSGEAACHLGMAYVDGNGTVIDLAEAKIWLRLGANKGHRFCIFKLAEIEIEECIHATKSISPVVHAQVNQLCEMARLGIGEACVSLHFLLQEHGVTLRNQGWNNPQATEVARQFMHALDLAYKYRKADSYQPLLTALLDLGKLGSGPAYHAAGELCRSHGEEQLALACYGKGAKECREKACVRVFLEKSEGRQRDEMITWSVVNCPTPSTFMLAANHAISVNFERGLQVICQALDQCLADDEAEEAVKLTRGMIDSKFLENDASRGFLTTFLLKLRDHGIENLDHHLSNALIQAGHRQLIASFYEQGQRPSHNGAGPDGLNATWYPYPEGSQHVGGFDKLSLPKERLSELEFEQIEEHGRLMLGCAQGNAIALKTAMKSCMDQTICNPRIKQKGMQMPPRILLASYLYGRAAEIAAKEQIPQLAMARQHPMLAAIRDKVEEHLKDEAVRWQQAGSQRAFVNFLGRAGRCSQRIIKDFEQGVEIRSGHFQPWRPLIQSEAAHDPVGLAIRAELQSTCPITKDWMLPAEDGYNYLGTKECALLTDLARNGEYVRATQMYACEMTMINTARFREGITFSFGRIAESAKLSIIAREMYFGGDYAVAEKIIDYLIFTEDLPQGRLHHISGWIKYKLGKLSEAVTMLQDCPQAAQCDGLSAANTDADVMEYRLLLAELLMRDERLREANDVISRLKADCEARGIQDFRLFRVQETIEYLHLQTNSDPMTLMFESILTSDRSTTVSRVDHDHDLPDAKQILMTPLGQRGMPCNMDRYRCLFPEIGQAP